jgi:hypothetical protein
MKKEHYVTLFDSTFLPQGLALHHSLVEHAGDFVLWILCLDQNCLQTLQRLNLQHVRLLDLPALETPELLSCKQDRSRAEYCWTLTPFSIQWVLEQDPSAERVTYIDADVFFLKSPSGIFAELDQSGKAVLITEHGYAPDYDQTPSSGRFCVQFLPISRGAGEQVLHWWRDRCLEWCYARSEDGKFGDQGYLESFPELFPDDIYIIGDDCRFQAPWNACMHACSKAVVYHFHSLRIDKERIRLSSRSPYGVYRLPGPTLANIYAPYCELIDSICANTLKHRPSQISPSTSSPRLGDHLKKILRRDLRLWLSDAEKDFIHPRQA